VQPIPIAWYEAKPGDRITLYGWGTDLPSGDSKNLPRRLQQLRTTVVPKQRCGDAFISAGEFCTDNLNGTAGPGPGDSGGAAVAVVNGVRTLVGTCRASGWCHPGRR